MFMILLLICGDVEVQPGPQSLSRVEFQEFISRKGMKIVHQNIRGLESNFDMLQEFVESHDKIDILTLSETHLTDNSFESCSNYRDIILSIEIVNMERAGVSQCF